MHSLNEDSNSNKSEIYAKNDQEDETENNIDNQHISNNK